LVVEVTQGPGSKVWFALRHPQKLSVHLRPMLLKKAAIAVAEVG
jgi:hypothetical protein